VSKLFDWFRGKRTAPPKQQQRMYYSAKSSRLTAGFSSSDTSADSELSTSLQILRARSRQLVRDAPYAGRAQSIVVNNVIGGGIGLQAQVKKLDGALFDKVNDEIEEAHLEWSRATNCHMGGELSLFDIERWAIAQLFEAGECLIRMHPVRVGQSTIPLALEVIESERLADLWNGPTPPRPRDPSAQIRMGVEVDAYQRPQAYWIRSRHPGDFSVGLANPAQRDTVERVPASDLFHVKLITRWPQTRGVPAMHAVIRKLQDLDEYSGAELTAAKSAANYLGTVETSDPNSPLIEQTADGYSEMQLEQATLYRLAPGEHLNYITPNRPNAAMPDFIRACLREFAAGVGCSYESISKDYSQSNYSSSRLALLDDRDGWRTLQQWWIRTFREPLYRRWLNWAVASGTVASIPQTSYWLDLSRYQAVRFKPRGWSWIDPTKEVEAAKQAVMAGFTTVSDVISANGDGKDIEDIVETREAELEMMREAGLSFDTEVKPEPAASEPRQNAPQPASEDDGTQEDQQVVRLRR